jgi:hypothetical protein
MTPVFRPRFFRGRLWGRVFAAFTTSLLLGSCARLLGWGVLLWSSEDPPVPSGAVLPVYIRSNIDGVWVVGVPEDFRQPENSLNKFEIPLAKLELVGSKKKARERAGVFSPLALSYAETLQDGLPIREHPDNGARRVYRLKPGEIIKILERVEGVPAISTTGTPLPGDWYRVLTEDGSVGFCFSYRLRIFEYTGGPLTAIRAEGEEEEDPELERVLSKIWSPDWYGTMINTRKIDLEDLSRQWHFSPGIDTGIAQIYLPNLDRAFAYTGIRSAGNRAWRFEGAPLQMSLRSDTTLAVQYTEEGGAPRTLLFVALPSDVEDLAAQETARREELYNQIYAQGPVFSSVNYGALSFREEERFAWTGYDLLVPRIIPASAAGNGRVSMDLFLDASLQDRYGGAFSLIFDGIGDAGAVLRFMYTLDAQGFRVEYVPEANIEGLTVKRRASSPTVIYFFRVEQPRPLPVPAPEARRGPGLPSPPPGFPDPQPPPEAGFPGGEGPGLPDPAGLFPPLPENPAENSGEIPDRSAEAERQGAFPGL